MKKLIHWYLDTYFIVGNSVIYKKKKEPSIIGFFDISSNFIITELKQVFVLNKKELKWYVKSWIKKHNKHFKFNDWWTPVINYLDLFPKIERVNARLMAAELVRVEPLPAPNGRIHYLDYVYGIDPINDNPVYERRRYDDAPDVVSGSISRSIR